MTQPHSVVCSLCHQPKTEAEVMLGADGNWACLGCRAQLLSSNTSERIRTATGDDPMVGGKAIFLIIAGVALVAVMVFLKWLTRGGHGH